MTTTEDAERLKALLRDRIEAAAKDHTLAEHHRLAFLLCQWSIVADDKGEAARAWTTELYASDLGVKQLAKAFTSSAYSQGYSFSGLADLIPQRTAHIDQKNMAEVVDMAGFLPRVKELAATEPDVAVFWETWRPNT